MKLRAINNTILFRFVDPVNSKGEFEKGTTESGILLKSTFDDSAKTPRWVIVDAVGPDVLNVKVGQHALLPALRWTAASKFEGNPVWKTDETQVVAVRDPVDPNNTLAPIGSNVLFSQKQPSLVTTSFGLIIASDPTDTPKGFVTAVGPDVFDDVNVGSAIYYDSANFFDTFVHAGATLAFIAEEKILAYVPVVVVSEE